MSFTWLTCFHSSENGPKRLECWQQTVRNESEAPPRNDPRQSTHVWRFELVDDGCFAAVVKPQTQNVDLLLPQAKPGRELIQQPHWTARTGRPCRLTHQPTDGLMSCWWICQMCSFLTHEAVDAARRSCEPSPRLGSLAAQPGFATGNLIRMI